MTLEDMNLDVGENNSPPDQAPNNRTFIVVAGILGAIMIIGLVCIAVYALVLVPQRSNQRATEVAQINAQNTQMAAAFTQTRAAAAAITFTPTATLVPVTPTPSRTSVVIVPTNTPLVATVDPRTATVSALLTQAALAQQTRSPTPTALPTTGFADQVGIPGLLGLAAILIVVIFLSRRLRAA